MKQILVAKYTSTYSVKKVVIKNLSKQKEIFGLEGELKSTQPPNNDSSSVILQWVDSFTSANDVWISNRNELRQD